MNGSFPLFVFLILAPVLVSAQPLGTFRWQLQPYCNVVRLAVTQNDGVYELEGTDDQCGADKAASAIGTAFLNADGTIGFGLAIVSAPSGAPVHIESSISLSTLSGTWHDSAGASGAFVFTPGASAGGSPRPAPANGIAPGAVGSAQVDASQVQLRVNGGCSSGQFMQGVGQSGSVVCGTEIGDLSAVNAGAGVTGGGSSGSVTLSLPTTPSGAFRFDNDSGFVAVGTFLSGPGVSVSGAGTRAMWYARKAAFRAGNVVGSQWDEGSIGNQSVAFGANTTASGTHSTATGDSTLASGARSVALGYFTTASGAGSTATGDNTVAGGAQSVALGRFTTASGAHAIATGNTTVASGENSSSFGWASQANGTESVAMGLRVVAGGNGSVVLGSDATALAAASGTFIFADRSTVADLVGFAPNEFIVRAAGGFGLYTNAALTTGVEMAANTSQWLQLSDANMKEGFRDLDQDDLLARFARMPVQEWSYKAQGPSIRHVGPTAQDFLAAFGLGEDPLRIGTLDASGIALAGVRALEGRTRALREENQVLRAALDDLRREIHALKRRE